MLLRSLRVPAVALLVMVSLVSQGRDLMVNGMVYAVDTLVYKHSVGPGVEYARYRLPERPLDIFVLETNLTNPYVVFEVWNGGDAAFATERPTARYAAADSAGRQVIAAHNGDFYTVKKGRVGMSRMGLIGAGEVLFNPTGKPLLVVDADNRPYVDSVFFCGTVAARDMAMRLHTVNQLRLEWEPSTDTDRLSLFTPAFGDTLVDMPGENGRVVSLRALESKPEFRANKPGRFTVVEVADYRPGYGISRDGAVLFGAGASAEELGHMHVGDTLTLTMGVRMPRYEQVTDFREAVGGSGHILLRDGKVPEFKNRDLHPRTFMGIDSTGTRLYHVVVDGRSELSAGIEFADEGRLLEWLGAWQGINLDGGGSSCMVVNGDIVNRGSDGRERSVGNGVLLYSTAPADDVVTRIAFAPVKYDVEAGCTMRPVVYGYNQYGALVNRDLSEVTLSCDHQLGRISSDGVFVAGECPASGYIYVAYKGLQARRRVVVTRTGR